MSPRTRAERSLRRSGPTSSRVPDLKRSAGKSVTTRHFSSPRTPCGLRIWATTSASRGSDDVEVDADALARGGGFDEGAEAADDPPLAADDLADVLLADLELVDGGVAILDLADFYRVRLVDERPGDVLDQALEVGLELLELVVVLVLIVELWRDLRLGHD